MKPFFSTVERVLQLETIAESWRGTPFMPNAAIKGAGVSCQKLVGAILVETGAVPPTFAAPDAVMNWSHAQRESLMEKFMAAQTEFFVAVESPQPGDVLGFKLGGCVHHCGILFHAGGKFVHCLRPDGVRYNNLRDAGYSSRREKIWRPIER